MKFTRSLLCIGLMAVAAQTTALAANIGEGKLDIVAWPGYLERGQTVKGYDWLTQFEADTGCKVNVKTAASSDEMVTLMSQGVYDLVTASGDASLRLIAGKRVQAIDTSKIKDFAKIDPRLKNAPWYVVDGKTYGVPYQWGPNVLMYNTEAFKGGKPDSWSVVFEEQNLPDGKTNKGRVQAFDTAIYIADAALYLKGKNPALGIKDPYELNETQYKAVLEVLRKQKPLVHRYWHDYNVQMSDFKNEGVVASSSWPFQVNLLKSEKKPIASVFPKEGVTGWADTTMMHTQAKNPKCAYAFMNWQLDDRLQAPLAEWFGANPVTTTACAAKTPGGGKPCETNGHTQFEKIAFWKTPQAKCGSHKEGCVPYSTWTKDFIAIMGGR